MNDLGLGQYSVTAALHRGTSYLDKGFDYIERAVKFEVVDRLTEYFEGRVRLHVETNVEPLSEGARVDLIPMNEGCNRRFSVLGRRNPSLTDFSATLTPMTLVDSLDRAADVLVELDVTNVGTEKWGAIGRRAVHIAYHWMREDGSLLEFDGLRTTLPRDVEPGETVRVSCFLRAVEERGVARLVWTLVQEEVAWFDERKPTSRFECMVTIR